MKKNKTGVPLLISSIFQILCAGWNGVWIALAAVMKLLSAAENITSGSFDYGNLSDWLGLVNSSTIVLVLHSFLTSATSFFQVISAIIGIVFACSEMAGKEWKLQGITFALGVVSIVTGALALVCLLFSGSLSLGLLGIMMIIPLVAMPVIFTVTAKLTA